MESKAVDLTPVQETVEMFAPENCTAISVGGQEYSIEQAGERFVVPKHLREDLLAHGFTDVPPKERKDGPLEEARVAKAEADERIRELEQQLEAARTANEEAEKRAADAEGKAKQAQAATAQAQAAQAKTVADEVPKPRPTK